MFRQVVQRAFKRFYHQEDSSFRQKTKRAPVVKYANSRVSRAFRERVNRDVEPRISQYDVNRTFEPFPFKVTEENKADVVRTLITPLHKINYEEQLASKESFCKNSLRLLARDLYNMSTPVRLNVSKLPCHVNPIVRAPKLFNYRNKCDYSIWRGMDGKTKTIGFLAHSIAKHGDSVCVEPNDCLATHPDCHKLTDILQDFIRNQAQLSVSYDVGIEGGWRRFSIRINEHGELMLIGHLNPRTLKVHQVVDERDNFREFVAKKANENNIKLKSIYLQPCPHNKCSHQVAPYELIYGDKTLFENINGLKLMISPETYLPHNTSGAEVLYKTIRETVTDCFIDQSGSKQNRKPLIIDANCGPGTIALQLADMASMVVGVDSSTLAIEDATENAKINDIKNANFYNLNLEIGLGKILNKFARFKNDAMVVCNVPKSGLPRNVDEAIRNCPEVKKIIYVTHSPDSSGVQKNLINFCRKLATKSGPPFVPVSATPVDLYPHTEFCEFIIALERLPE